MDRLKQKGENDNKLWKYANINNVANPHLNTLIYHVFLSNHH